MILDESGSIAERRSDRRRADGVPRFHVAPSPTPARAWRCRSSRPLPGCLCPARPTRLHDGHRRAINASIFDPYITNNYNPSGSTHWEDAFRVGRYFLPRPSADTPHLTVFITDGDPNRIVRDLVPTSPQTEYEIKVPLSDSETTSTSERPCQGPGRPQRQRPQGAGLAHPDGGSRRRAQQPGLAQPDHRRLRAGRLQRHGHVQHHDRRRVPRAQLRRARGRPAGRRFPAVRALGEHPQARRRQSRPERSTTCSPARAGR